MVGLRLPLQQPWPSPDDGRESWTGQADVCVKVAPDDYPLLLLNEFVANRLATGLGIPTPPGDVGQLHDGRFCWVSATITFLGQTPAPATGHAMAQAVPALAAATVAFDSWILNNDRHDDNVIFHRDIGLWLIDHDQCLGGKADTQIDTVLRNCVSQVGRHRLFQAQDIDDAQLQRWNAAIRNLPLSVVDGVLEEATNRRIATKEHAGAIRRFLAARKQVIGDLTQRALAGGVAA